MRPLEESSSPLPRSWVEVLGVGSWRAFLCAVRDVDRSSLTGSCAGPCLTPSFLCLLHSFHSTFWDIRPPEWVIQKSHSWLSSSSSRFSHLNQLGVFTVTTEDLGVLVFCIPRTKGEIVLVGTMPVTYRRLSCKTPLGGLWDRLVSL